MISGRLDACTAPITALPLNRLFNSILLAEYTHIPIIGQDNGVERILLNKGGRPLAPTPFGSLFYCMKVNPPRNNSARVSFKMRSPCLRNTSPC